MRGNAPLSLNTVVCTKVCFKALFKEGCIKKKKEIRVKKNNKEGWLQDRLYSVSPFY